MDKQNIEAARQTMVEDIQNTMPTMIVMPFQAVRFSLDGVEHKYKGDIVKAMIESDKLNKASTGME